MLLRRFTTLLQRKFPGVSLQPFGSYVSVFHTAGGLWRTSTRPTLNLLLLLLRASP
jgi:hypothetical protein